VNIAAKLAPMRKGCRLENLGGPPEFTLRPAFAGPAARAMTIFGWNVVRATTDFPRTALRYSEKVSTSSLRRDLRFVQSTIRHVLTSQIPPRLHLSA
jgi:hypothetical protein